jgi:Ca2+-binding RTX toxin-like protein
MPVVAVNEGSAFLINSATQGAVTREKTTVLADGRIAVVWQETTGQNGDVSGSAVKAQILNADGTVSVAEFLVNTTTLGDQVTPSISAMAGGGFVVAWQDGSFAAAARGQDIRAQVFGANGAKSGAELLVNSTTGGDQTAPSVAGLANGTFAVTWADASGGTTATKFAVYTAGGAPVAGETAVASHFNATLNYGATPNAVIETTANNFSVINTQVQSTFFDNTLLVYNDSFNATGTATQAGVRLYAAGYRSSSGGGVLGPSDIAYSAALGTVAAYEVSILNPFGVVTSNVIEVAAYSAAGVATSLATISVPLTTPVTSLAIATVHGTDVILAYADSTGVHIGTVSGGTFFPVQFLTGAAPASGTEFDITVLPQGRFMVSWTDASGAVMGQLYNYISDATSQDGTAGADILIGTAGRDILRGFNGNDVLVGAGGIDLLYGGAGDDVLITGAGASIVNGDAGNDTYYITDAATQVVELANEGYDAVHSTVNYVLPVEVEALFLSGAALNATGNAVDNLIVGNELDNVIDGGAGSDLLYGGDGNDTIFGGAGDNLLAGQAGNDWLQGSTGIDKLLGGDGNDVLLGDAGNDTLYGEAGNDTLVAGDGDDQLYGGIGQDNLYGGTGNDQIFAEAGDDHVYAGIGDDLMYGGDGVDWLWGEGGNDVLIGQYGDDVLLGQDGNDFFVFDAGTDSAYGGAGVDTFFWSSYQDGADVISDFSHAEGDKIYFDHTAFGVAAGLTLVQGTNFFFGAGAHPTQATATVSFDTSTNILWYDPDGTGVVGAHAITFLSNGGGGITAADILFI